MVPVVHHGSVSSLQRWRKKHPIGRFLWWARKAEKSRAAVDTDDNFFAISKVLVVCLQRAIKR
jgi:hypothetical protein